MSSMILDSVTVMQQEKQKNKKTKNLEVYVQWNYPSYMQVK